MDFLELRLPIRVVMKSRQSKLILFFLPQVEYPTLRAWAVKKPVSSLIFVMESLLTSTYSHQIRMFLLLEIAAHAISSLITQMFMLAPLFAMLYSLVVLIELRSYCLGLLIQNLRLLM